MKSFLHRVALLLAATAFAMPARAEKPAADRDYVRYVGDNKRGKLETVIVTMKKDDITVELVGAVHVADPAYYQALTKLFAGYEELLFELVDGQRMKEEMEGKRPVRGKAGAKPAADDDDAAAPDEKERSPAFKIISSVMHGFGNYFHLHVPDGRH